MRVDPGSGPSPLSTGSLTLAAFSLMELCWVSLAIGLAWIGWADGQWPFPLLLLVPSLIGMIAARATPARWGRRRWFDWYRWGLALLSAIVFGELAAAGAPGAGSTGRLVLALAIGTLLFWRGWLVSEDEPDSKGVEVGFQVGAVAVLPLLAILQWAAPGAGQLPAVSFFLFGLLAIGLARRGERRSQGSGPEPDWLAMAGLLALATVLAAGGLLLLISPDVVELLVAQAIWPIRLLGWLLAGLFRGGTAQPPATTGLLARPEASPVATAAPIDLEAPLWLMWLLERVADALLVLILAYGLYRLVQFGLRRRRRGAADARGVDHPRIETLPVTWSSWWRDLLRRLLRWLWPSRTPAPPGTASAHEAARATAEQRGVRALYRSFLATTAQIGHRRPAHQTPLEFAAHLAARQPAARSALRQLTELYVRVRYGEDRVGSREVAAMRAAVADATRILREPAGDGR